jgi:hypothetical protein
MVASTEATIDRATTAPTIRSVVANIRSKPNEAARAAKSAETCALAGSVTKAVTASMEAGNLQTPHRPSRKLRLASALLSPRPDWRGRVSAST